MIIFKNKPAEYKCTECFDKVSTIVAFNNDYDDKYSVWLCKKCLKKALCSTRNKIAIEDKLKSYEIRVEIFEL